mmetsp:Transcript_10002/g.24472  ORF Transcript_10002/g.24472 Transcript_10002/m.24472 type:complete len:211 (-) Transcript_10002:565-1197(-)
MSSGSSAIGFISCPIRMYSRTMDILSFSQGLDCRPSFRRVLRRCLLVSRQSGHDSVLQASFGASGPSYDSFFSHPSWPTSFIVQPRGGSSSVGALTTVRLLCLGSEGAGLGGGALCIPNAAFPPPGALPCFAIPGPGVGAALGLGVPMARPGAAAPGFGIPSASPGVVLGFGIPSGGAVLCAEFCWCAAFAASRSWLYALLIFSHFSYFL